MQRYIDRFQLLNALAGARFTRRHSRPARPFTVADCLRIARELPPALRWIPVTERLPRPETEVLAAFDSGQVCSLWQDWALSPDEDPFLYARDPAFTRPLRATHWLPLPPPPGKAEGKGEQGKCPTTT